MFESLAGQLRGGVPDRLASVLDTDLRDTRRAMEVSLPALIGGLRDKSMEPGGAEDLLDILDGPAGEPIDDVDGYLLDNDARIGAGVLDQVFDSRGENALTSLGKASGLGTKLLAQVMSMLAPVAISWLARKQYEEDFDAGDLRVYLGGEADTLEEAGYGKVLALVSGESAPAPQPVADTPAPAAVAPSAPPRTPPVVTVNDTFDDASFEDDLRIPATPDQLDASAIPGAGSRHAEATAAAPRVVIGDVSDSLPGSAMPSGSAPVATLGTRGDGAEGDRDFDYGGTDRWGWAWWLLAAVALAFLAALFWVQCTGDDDSGDGTVETSAEPTQVEVESPQANPQDVLTESMASFPGVTGVLDGDRAILSGSVGAAEVREAAGATAALVEGVNSVENNIQIGDGNRIPDAISTNPDLTILYQLINEAGLQDQLAGPQSFTLFAPSDAAFNALGTDQFAALRAEPASLQSLLYYHLASGEFPSADLDVGGDLSSIQGEALHFEKNEGVQEINFAAKFAQTDIQTENGLIHIIDQVLLPAELGGGAAAEPDTPAELGAALELSPITFESSSATLTSAGQIELDKVVAYLTENPQNVEVAGHTDTTGPEDLNKDLSQQRADAVRQYLIDKGIAGETVTAIGYGESQPLITPDENDEAAKEKNRRIEFVLGV